MQITTEMYCPLGGGICKYAQLNGCGKEFPNLIACREYWRGYVNMDTKFIRHIQAHLEEGQEVICKICGKTAKEIIEVDEDED